MKPIIENGILATDLDCQNFFIRNVQQLRPVPAALLDIADPRLSDPRPVPDGSVTNESVAAIAAIDQSKLKFDLIPPAWKGTGSNQAAQGNLSERLENKGVAGGYAGLTAAGILDAANVTTGIGAGSVNSVGLRMPPQFDVSGSPVTESGDLTVTWQDAPDKSWLGVDGTGSPDAPPRPGFSTHLIPLELIPDLDAAKFTSDFFDPDRLPPAMPMGVDHSTGGIPPQFFRDGDETDYLGRDIKWHAMTADIDLQPKVSNPQVVVVSIDYDNATYKITLSNTQPGAFLFYRELPFGSGYHKATENPVVLNVVANNTVQAYAARAGYNNSEIVTFNAPPLPIP